MTQIKVTYFDMDGGRAEPIRLALAIGGIEFEDFRFKFPEFAEVRKNTPLGQVPTMTIDGEQMTQCNALTRYVGKLVDMYPKGPFQALICDEIMDSIEDITYRLVGTFDLEGDALKQAREAIIESNIKPHLLFLERKLASSGEFFACDRLTIADLKAFVYFGWLNSGMLDHIPTDIVATTSEKLQAHFERVKSLPSIQNYYANRG